MKEHQGTVIIVDDLPDNVMQVEKTLQKKGYLCKIATTGIEALELIREIKPDLILLDILMPQVNGIETCKAIKSDESIKHIPVIFLTALNDSSYIIEAFKSGGVDYITKPFNNTELLVRVKSHIDLKKALEANRENITKLTQANRELNEARQLLTDLNNAKDKFFSIIAHDLRNPFQGLFKMTEFILKEKKNLSEEEIFSMLADIHSSADKLNRLLENLLTWSRIQLGKLTVNPESHNLYQIIDFCIQLFLDNAKQKNISITNNVPKDITIFADASMVNTVFRNLLSNAIKFTNILGSITINAELQGRNVVITVTDTGIGMSRNEVENIFRIDAKQLKSGTNGEIGTGIGLVLCKELVESNFGSISISSKLDHGTTFKVTLPSDI